MVIIVYDICFLIILMFHSKKSYRRRSKHNRMSESDTIVHDTSCSIDCLGRFPRSQSSRNRIDCFVDITYMIVMLRISRLYVMDEVWTASWRNRIHLWWKNDNKFSAPSIESHVYSVKLWDKHEENSWEHSSILLFLSNR